MSKKSNPTLIGAFILGAITLLIGMLILFGGGRLFGDSFACVLYFDESISGLDVGAPVEFQGVRVGAVTDVRLVFDEAGEERVLRPVRIKIERKRVTFAHDYMPSEEMRRVLETMVAEKGLRARLANQSLLTGKLKVELGLFPDSLARRKYRGDQEWEMPTVSSPLQHVTEEIAQLPFAEIVADSHRIVSRLADLLESDEIGESFAHLNQTLASLESVMDRIAAETGPLSQQSAELVQLVRSMLEDMRSTSRSIRNLADTLEQNPEAILRGKK